MWKGLLRDSVFLLVLSGACGAGRADDTILGLPAPRDASHPGAVMLHGGGRVTTDAFDRFVELAGGKQARLVLVPSAGYRTSEFETRRQFLDAMTRRFDRWVKLATARRVNHFEFLSTDNPADADDPAFLRPLTSATGVWFSGGAQSRLNYRYVGEFPRATRFQSALRDVVARGGVVGGTSAGMAALPEIMTMNEHRDHAEGPLSAVTAHGLGLFTGAIVEQHFDERSGRFERFLGLLRDSARLERLAGRAGAGPNMLGLAVEGSTGVVLHGDRLEALGGGNAHVFIKSRDDRTITWHTLKSGEKALLHRDTRGQVVLVPEH